MDGKPLSGAHDHNMHGRRGRGGGCAHDHVDDKPQVHAHVYPEGDRAHARGIVETLVYLRRQAIPPFRGV